MGATSADTQREIEEIRKDIASAATELQSRARRLVDFRSGVAGAQPATRVVTENPFVLPAVALAGAGAVGLIAFRAVSEARKRRRPQERLKRTVLRAAEDLGERWQRVREALPTEVRLSGRDDEENEAAEVRRSSPNMVKRMLWTALVAAMMAGGGLVARRLSAAVWRAAMREEPPHAAA